MSTREELRLHKASASPAGQVVVAAAGDLDVASSQQLVRRVHAALEQDESSMLVLDLADVNFIDSSGISAVILCQRSALAAGRCFRIANLTSPVRRTLQLAGVVTVLPVNEDEAARSERPSLGRDPLAALSQYLVGDATMTGTLQRILEIVVSALPGADHAGISMTVDGRVTTHQHSNPEVAEIHRLEYEIGEGPSIDALLTGEPVLVSSTGADARYPRFGEAAHQRGIHAVLSLPMRTNANVVGVLNLCSTTEDAFAPSDIEVAATFATQAAFVLANAQAYWDARALSENLTQAMQSRAEIEQAKGIIMATAGLSADAAFQQLVKQSQHENIKVRDLAIEVVRRTQRSTSREHRA